jgi:hypothetical protein
MTKKEMMKLAKRISKHKPPVHLTTEQLAEAAIQTVKQMTPVEKALLRRRLNRDVLLQKTARRLRRCADVVRDMKCDHRVN